MKIINRLSTKSTNEYIKKFAVSGMDTAVFTAVQPKGKGTKGRSFVCKYGGVYVSLLIFLKNFSATENFKLMVQSSMSVVNTLKEFGVDCGIKWPNDIYAKGKKICGILIENKLCGSNIKYTIIGSGININNKLPKALKANATSAREIIGKKISLKKFKKAYIKNFTQNVYTLKEYRENLIINGKIVTIIEGDKTYAAKAMGVTDTGELLIDIGGAQKKLSSAEISIKI